jgi:hypothetical protein
VLGSWHTACSFVLGAADDSIVIKSVMARLFPGVCSTDVSTNVYLGTTLPDIFVYRRACRSRLLSNKFHSAQRHHITSGTCGVFLIWVTRAIEQPVQEVINDIRIHDSSVVSVTVTC